MLIVICLIKQILLFLVPYLWKTLKKICYALHNFLLKLILCYTASEVLFSVWNKLFKPFFPNFKPAFFFLLAARTGSRLGIYAYNQRVFQSLLRILRPSLFIMSSVVDKKLKDTFFSGFALYKSLLTFNCRSLVTHWFEKSNCESVFKLCIFAFLLFWRPEQGLYLTVKNPHTTNSKKGCLSITR